MTPVYFSQHDKRWKNYPYRVKDEKTTISSSGCGVTCSAMVINSLFDKNIYPHDTAWYSMQTGGKAYKQGTYYSYFANHFKIYGLTCTQLNYANDYKKTTASTLSNVAKSAIDGLNKGKWLICAMGKGKWTNSGHFVLAYKYANGRIFIHDPNTTKKELSETSANTFFSEVKYCFALDVQEFIK